MTDSLGEVSGALFNIHHWTDRREMEQIVLQRRETARERERERREIECERSRDRQKGRRRLP